MKVVGLITEYNPFHNGHKYHIEEAKRVTGADYVIAVMSGNFVQRGAPAVIDKYSRTLMALNNGVDLVLELPVCYAVGSAEYFAHGAVSLLDKLGIVDFLCFGSEVGDIKLLKQATDLLLNAPNSYHEKLKDSLREGMTYPAARWKALQHEHDLSNTNPGTFNELSKILNEPNNILGIEYLKAISSLNSRIGPVTIKRKAAHYHDTELCNINQEAISSATAIRKVITGLDDELTRFNSTDSFTNIINNDLLTNRINMKPITTITSSINSDRSIRNIEPSVPSNVYHLLMEQYLKTYPINEEDFSTIIKYKLLSENRGTLSSYVDISSDLADRLKNTTELNLSLTELAKKLKTKNMTLTRINRALFHLLLNIRSDELNEYNANGYCSYARVLGIRKQSSHLLRSIEREGNIPLITKVSRAEEQLDSLGFRMLQGDLFAAHLYNQAVYAKYNTNLINEYKHGIVIQ